MNLIVAADKNWGIGCKNELLVSIPADKKFFRAETAGKVIIMGRRTLESLPNGQPLKDRTNIVLTKRKDYSCNGAVVVHSIEEAIKAAERFATEDIYVIGGGTVYEQMLPFCTVAYVTKIDYAYRADTYFPNLDKDEEWELVDTSEEQTYYDLIYEFRRYERKK